jgi:hypothetical protein
VLAHFDHFRRVNDRQEMLNAAELGKPGQGGCNVSFASDELDLVAEILCGADGALDRRRWRVITAHCIERHTQHPAQSIIPRVAEGLLEAVRAGAEAVAGMARFVLIDQARLAEYVRSVPLERARAPELDPATHYLAEPDATLAYLITLDTVNFGSGYFPRLRKRPGLSGYFTIAASLKNHFENHGPLRADELCQISATDCARIFGQSLEDAAIAELMSLFAKALNDLGRALQSYRTFRRLVEAADGSAERLVRSVEQMPFYHDVEPYTGRDVPFYKRAQLLAADLSIAGVAHFRDLDQLTMFADNLVPHVLRVDGVLIYDPELLARINREELIPAGSAEEVEIRACAVHAVELMARSLRAEDVDVSPMQLDYVLWNRGQEPAYKALPRHRSRTVFY